MSDAGPLGIVLELTRPAQGLGIPLEVRLELTNRSASPLGFVLEHPRTTQIRCTVPPQPGIEARPASAETATDAIAPIHVLAPAEKRSFAFVLDQWVVVKEPGEYRVDYQVDISSWTLDAEGQPVPKTGAHSVASGSLPLRVSRAPDLEVAGYLVQAGNTILKGTDLEKEAALEALAYVASPAALDILGKALFDEATSPRAVSVLGRRSEPQAAALLKKALFDPQSGVVELALQLLRARSVPVDAATLGLVVSSPNDAIRYAVVNHLAQGGHEALLRTLAADPNAAVRKRASEVLGRQRP